MHGLGVTGHHSLFLQSVTRRAQGGGGVPRRAAQWPASCRRFAFVLVAVAVVACTSAWAVDPRVPLNELARDFWLTQDGLPQSSVSAILQSRDGYLWVGTQEGLARFDGVVFRTYDASNTAAIRSNFIAGIYQTRDGTLWATTSDGLIILRDGVFSALHGAGALPHNYVRGFCEDARGRIWVGTGAGLCQLQNQRCELVSLGVSPAPAIREIAAEDATGAIWVGTSRAGLYRVLGDSITSWTEKDGLPANEINTLVTDDSGVWVGTPNGLAHIVQGGLRVYTTNDGLSHNTILGLYRDREGALWIGTDSGGVCRWFDDRFECLPPRGDPPLASVNCITLDSEGNLWIGARLSGLNRLQDAGLAIRATEAGLAGNDVTAVMEDRVGDLWVGTYGHGLDRIGRNGITHFDLADGLRDRIIRSLHQDRAGTLWVGTKKGGLHRFDGLRFVAYGREIGLPNDDVRDIEESASGELWVGTYGGGVARMTGSTFDVLTTADGLSSNAVFAMLFDSRGDLWVGTNGGGLNRIRGREIKVFDEAAGLASPLVTVIHEDSRNQLWFGTLSGGIHRFVGDRLRSYRVKDGLADDASMAILEDDAGNFWVSSNRGIFRVARRSFDDFDSGRIDRIPAQAFGRRTGLASIECNGGFQPAGWRSKTGRLLFPSTLGLVVIDPPRLHGNPNPPRVVIDQVKADGAAIEVAGPAPSLPAATRQLEIAYAGLSLTAPRGVVYRYRLRGFDRGWQDVGSRREAFYTNLPSGRYLFEVMAANADGIWSEGSATFAFSILAPLWRRPWFLATVAFLLAAAIYLAGVMRHRRELRAEVEKALVVRDLTVGILHEARQPLQAMQSQIELARLRSGAERNEALDGALASVERLNLLFLRLEKVQTKPSVQTTPYAGQDTMVEIPGEEE
jgi:ligand-binding sensor domain-containing protein